MKPIVLLLMIALISAPVLPAIGQADKSAGERTVTQSASTVPSMPGAASPWGKPRNAIARADGFSDLATLSDQISVQASGRGKPWVNFGDGHELLSTYSGDQVLINQMTSGQAQPVSLAAADLDGDGVSDLTTGLATQTGGIIAVNRGNVDSIYPNSVEALERKSNGTFTNAPFLSPTRLFEVPTSPDFIETGDFNADGFTDISIASHGSNALYILPGDGSGGFQAPEVINLPGLVTSMSSGDVNRRDGLADLVVGVTSETGSELLVFEDPEGAAASTPEIIPLPGPASAISVGYLYNGTYADIAITAGRFLVVIHGRDRELGSTIDKRAMVAPPEVSKLRLSAMPKSLAIGEFDGDETYQTDEAAILLDNGRLEIAKAAGGYASELRISSLKSVTQANAGAQPRLMKATISSSGADDLIVMDQAESRLRLLVGCRAPAQAGGINANVGHGSYRDPIDLSVDDTPIAVLPLRLNPSARNDMVVLRKHHANVAVVPAQFDNIFTVTTTADQAVPCQYTLSTEGETFTFEGGTGNFGVTTAATCFYRATDPDSWVQITSGAGTGSGTVTFTVDSDPNLAASRQSTITVAPGVEFTITQTAAPCVYMVSPSGETFGGEGGPGSFNVTTGPTCSYTPTDPDSWVQITSGSGTGSGVVDFTVDGASLVNNRTSVITVAPGVGFTITQTPGPAVSVRFESERGLMRTVAAGSRKSAEAGLGTNVTAAAGSLRAAIESAETAPQGSSNEVVFNITGGGVPTIILDAALPSLPTGSNLTIDGTTQSASSGSPLVEINGAGNNVMVVPGSGAVVRGLVINNAGSPIQLGSGKNNIVEGNLIGTTLDGTTPSPNSDAGIIINGGQSNIIGGPAAVASNVIAASTLDGITITGTASRNTVIGNFIGTDETHELSLANQGNGVNVESGATSTTIGTPQAPNYLNTNGLNGISISSGANHLIQNNAIQGNGGNGMSISGAESTNIGGAQASDLGNGMWQNAQNGLVIGTGATGINVQGNGIGVAFSGSTPTQLPNTLDGVSISASANLIGGIQTSLGNVIAFNGGDGVAVVSGDADEIFSNVIAANTPGLAIHLFSGANNNIQPPSVSGASVTSAGSSASTESIQSASVVPASSAVMVISFAFKSTPNQAFNMQFFVPQICNCTDCFTNVGIYTA
ncbi:MAG TPA: FG-GAP-like repeat-containing protein, partial [Blastocatellia bacterium]